MSELWDKFRSCKFLLILFWVTFLIFYFSYLFRVVFLAFLVIFLILVFIRRLLYLKYLVVLVYIRGVVVFILYISCMCWFLRNKFSWWVLILRLSLVRLYDLGYYFSIRRVREYLWIFLFFRFMFNSLVFRYSLCLFKVAGSLRF